MINIKICKHHIRALSSMVPLLITSSLFASGDPLEDSYTVIPRDDLLMNLNYLFIDDDEYYDRGRLTLTDDNDASESTRYRDLNDIIDHEQSVSSDVNETHSGLVRFSSRLWNVAEDSVVSIYPRSEKTKYSISIGQDTYITSDKRLRTTQPKYTYGISADFTGVGTEQFIYVGSDVESDWEAHVISAADPNDETQGITTQELTGMDWPVIYYGTPTVADLDGDGNKEIAFLSGDGVTLWTVCAGDIEGTECEGKSAYDIIDQGIVDSSGLGSDFDNDMDSNGLASGQILAGNYHDDGQELFIVGTYERSNGDWRTQIRYLRFDDDLTATTYDTTNITGDDVENRGGYVLAAKYRANTWSTHDSVVVIQQKRPKGNSSDTNKQYWNFIDYADYELSVKTTEYGKDESYRLIGLAVGNFKDLPEDEIEDSDYLPVIYRLEAMYTYSNKMRLSSYEYEDDEFSEIGDEETWEIGIDDFNSYNGDVYAMNMPFRTRWDIKKDTGDSKRTVNKLAVSDFRGQSEKLGSPLVINLDEYSNVFVKLGALPAHVDYIDASNGESTVVNISRPVQNKSDFNSSITEENSETVSSTAESVSTLTNAFMASVKVEVNGSEKVAGMTSSAGASIEVGGGASFENKETQINTNQTSVTETIDNTAYENDKVAFQTFNTTLYYYPVVGQYVCPDIDGEADYSCDESEKKQRYLLVTSPEISNISYTGTENISWYQPVYETNNLLSYPTSEAQLIANNEADINVINSDTTLGVDSGGISKTIVWDESASSTDSKLNVTTGNWFINMKQSASVGVKVGGTGTSGEVTTKQEYTGSDSISNTITSVNTFSAKTSIAINATGGLVRDSSNYGYNISPVIYGEASESDDDTKMNASTAPSSVVEEAIDENGESYDFTGAFRLGFYIDDLIDDGGNFWSGDRYYGSGIDISLNNPTRWETSNQRDTLGDDEQNCLSSEIYGNCLIPYQPDSSPYILENSFYNMKGLFIYGEDNSATRIGVYEEEILTLKARIYNYSTSSLVDMGADKVKVQFYIQEFDQDTLELKANAAIKIGEDEIDNILGFGGEGADERNWEYAQITFDTTGYGSEEGIEYRFWIVAWPVDASGNYVGELAGKGLDMSSYSGSDFANITDVPLEYVEIDYTEDGKATVEGKEFTFTNNVGLYNQEFMIYTPVSDDELSSISGPLESDNELVSFVSSYLMASSNGDELNAEDVIISLSSGSSNVTVTAEDTELGSKAYLVARIDISNEDRNTLIMYLVDETDAENKEILAIKRFGLLKNRNFMKKRLSYKPSECGTKTLTLYVGGLYDRASASQTFSQNISCH